MSIHHCHCGFKQHFQSSKLKSLGFGGAIFMVLHLLFHVAECLVIPSIIAFFNHNLHSESAVATDHATAIVSNEPAIDYRISGFTSLDQLQFSFSEELTYYYPL